MSKLKNTFGLPDSLIQVASEIHETSHLSPKQEKIAKLAGDPKEIDAQDFAALRQKRKMMKDSTEINDKNQLNEIGDTPAGQQALIAVIKRRQSQGWIPGKDKVIGAAVDRLSKGPIEIIKNSYEINDDSILEYDYKAHQQGQYPFSASQMTPLFAMIRTLLDFVQRTPALKKLMRDETGLDDQQLNPVLNFLEALNEEIIEIDEARGRPKGSKNKPKGGEMKAASKPSEDEEEPQGDAFRAPYSEKKDEVHPLVQLKGAMDDERGGRHIDTSQGKKYITSATAKKIHDHLMGLKAPDRVNSINDLYDLKPSHPMTTHILDDDRKAAEEGIKAPDPRKGRGRPKKETKSEDEN